MTINDILDEVCQAAGVSTEAANRTLEELRITDLQARNLFRTQVRQRLAKRGIADQTTLAADIALDRTTTTGALKRLQSRRFVDRATARHDRRSQACRLTRAGAALLGKMEKAARDAHLETVADLGKADQKRFIAMMQKIVAARSETAGLSVELD